MGGQDGTGNASNGRVERPTTADWVTATLWKLRSGRVTVVGAVPRSGPDGVAVESRGLAQVVFLVVQFVFGVGPATVLVASSISDPPSSMTALGARLIAVPVFVALLGLINLLVPRRVVVDFPDGGHAVHCHLRYAVPGRWADVDRHVPYHTILGITYDIDGAGGAVDDAFGETGGRDVGNAADGSVPDRDGLDLIDPTAQPARRSGMEAIDPTAIRPRRWTTLLIRDPRVGKATVTRWERWSAVERVDLRWAWAEHRKRNELGAVVHRLATSVAVGGDD